MFFPPFVVLGVWLHFCVCFILRRVLKLQLWACMWGAFKSSFRNLQAMQGLPNASPKYWGPVKSNTVRVCVSACACVRVGGRVCMCVCEIMSVWSPNLMIDNMIYSGIWPTLSLWHFHTSLVFFLLGRVQMWIGLIEWCLLRINKLGS